MGESPPLHDSVTLVMLCWGSDHISGWQGKSSMSKTWCCCSVCTLAGEEAAPGHIPGFGSASSAPGAGRAPWCRAKHGTWGQWGQSPPNPPCDTGRDPLRAISIPRRSQVHPLALRGLEPCRVPASSTATFLPSITSTQTVSQR